MTVTEVSQNVNCCLVRHFRLFRLIIWPNVLSAGLCSERAYRHHGWIYRVESSIGKEEKATKDGKEEETGREEEDVISRSVLIIIFTLVQQLKVVNET